MRPIEDGRYQVIYGFRRLQALRELQRETVWAIVHPDLSEEEALKERFAENSEREPYTPYEWILVCRDLEAKGYSRTKIAELIGKSSASVTRYFQLLSHPETLELLHRKEVSFREALKSISPARARAASAAEEEPPWFLEEEPDADREELRRERLVDPAMEELPVSAEADDLLAELNRSELDEPWSLSEGAGAPPFPQPILSNSVAYAPPPPLPQEERIHRLIRVVGKSISEVPFFQPPRISLCILSKASEEGQEEKVPALDILGLEVEQLMPFLERLKENLEGIGEMPPEMA